MSGSTSEGAQDRTGSTSEGAQDRTGTSEGSQDRSSSTSEQSQGRRAGEGVHVRRGRWAAAAMLAAAVAAGAAANAIDANFLASGWHTVQRGEEASDITVDNFQVHVHGAATSTQLEDLEVVTSPGAFVVVDLSYATTDAWDTPEEVVLIDEAGREFSEPSGFGSAGRVWPAGPDIWSRGSLLFEVPADVGDLALELRPQTPDARLPSRVLRVPLTVRTNSEPLTLERPSVLAEGDR
ncbi:hypothetical protein MWU75_08090 [Ornithinimicrobium sp. F0845]|uniref:hypothetical protein n=1 Tax=Ornithinimicrobium sp. F0845 TaxID=2926412 RepID=UPI001FF34F6C|nr:hypothetical protein [Ornithinimicrobium sp. F0845]MCK0112093.1 hypothetical protein [Ornithinimicrobium sp. F0845]